MSSKDIKSDTLDIVTKLMEGNDASHDIEHVKRVVSLALFIAKEEGITDPDTLEIIELGALLHDVCDYKYNSEGNISIIEDLFQRHSYPAEKANRVLHVIQNIGYKDELRRIEQDIEGEFYTKKEGYVEFTHKDRGFHTPELCVVQDADRLEALGAIGISRCIFYTATKGGLIHDPDAIPMGNLSSADYAARSKSKGQGQKQAASTHFHEKLFKLQYLMKTDTGKYLAIHRTQIMKQFIQALESEWKLEPYIFVGLPKEESKPIFYRLINPPFYDEWTPKEYYP